MGPFNSGITHAFLTHQFELSDRVVMGFFRTTREHRIPFEVGTFDHCVRDVDAHISTLANALAAGEPALFIDYVKTVSGAMTARNRPPQGFRTLLEIAARSLPEVLPEKVAGPACEFIHQALAECAVVGEPSTFIGAGYPLADAARQYVDHLVAGDLETAASIVWGAVRDGVDLSDVFLQILQPAQRELGRLWQMNRITVAREHCCTAYARMLMSQLMASSPRRGNGRTLVATCVEEERHDLGLAMVCHLLEMNGWNTVYVGADLPPGEVIGLMTDQHAQLLALSVTLTRHLQWVAAVIDVVRAASQARDVPIIVGGWPFVVAPNLGDKIGADAWAPDGRVAVEKAAELASAVGA